MIRRMIVEAFRKADALKPLETLALEMGLPLASLLEALKQEEKLDELCDLPSDDVFRLIEFYGSDTLFSERVTIAVRDSVLLRQRLLRIDSRKKRDLEGDK